MPLSRAVVIVKTLGRQQIAAAIQRMAKILCYFFHMVL
jgi:hypothetical protein